MRSTTRLAAVAAAAVAMLVGSAGTALAQSTSLDDKRYDVLLGDDSLASKGTYAERVAASGVDVDKITINHGTNFVSIRVNLHKLAEDAYVIGAVPINGGDTIDFQFGVEADGGGGIFGVTYPGEDSGRSTFCEVGGSSNALKGTSKVGTNGFIQLYVPRACFDNPKALRGAGVSVFEDYANEQARFTSPEAVKKAAAAPTDEEYVDPISPRYVREALFTKWLTRG